MEHSVAARSGSRFAGATEYEFWHLFLPRDTSRGAARRLLAEHAEYGRWELARLRRYPDGTRKVTLRRRILRVRRTL
ncbi:hypothetical protein G1H11_19960 [Phytoactinopolyspora alkaliphila]|uniref:Uncharacterized protein n=1 Tax=Phytoactinopolyspora alkaliphila TaxID=1783498 RepID=A0A6N9YRK4_9ACTN|nr:DUF5703 family protein [Phytoactinopolyspora alkaliphila]NED97577.1 hypothetical protein [Phytoactinopolyspora alkaliphila]